MIYDVFVDAIWLHDATHAVVAYSREHGCDVYRLTMTNAADQRTHPITTLGDPNKQVDELRETFPSIPIKHPNQQLIEGLGTAARQMVEALESGCGIIDQDSLYFLRGRRVPRTVFEKLIDLGLLRPSEFGYRLNYKVV